MTREELTNEIYKKLVEIKEMYLKEYPDGKYLDLTIINDSIMFCNRYWGENEDYSIQFCKNTLTGEGRCQ